MIKLNNKNITYVALADSNNSLKAPKEIWYADSNNSVKLVYRRKDALIEGEDYEKYHWLDGDGSAYTTATVNIYRDTINTLIIPTTSVAKTIMINCQTRIGDTNDYIELSTLIGSSGEFTSRHTVRLNNVGDTNIINVPNNYIDKIYTIKTARSGTNYVYYLNGSQVAVSNHGQYSSADFDVTPKIYANGCKLGYFSTSGSNEVNLIPCKLLKPVPKWLDANGIRRNIGECGMIDLVSGKFYGNVNNVGTFTVENYYERKEWLVGDGSAYIDTLHLANEGLDWETHVSNLSFKKHFVWNRVIKGECPAIALYHSVATNGTVRVQNNYTNSIVLQNQTNYDYIVATNSNGAVINGVQYIGQSVSENISNKSIKLFYCDINESAIEDTIIPYGGNSQDVKCAYFRFLDSNMDYIQNLIPCTLTMDLPASMDANNIARTKGTSGMWDLVSDKFYGNVANSGTFKAVNLAEGVDYEVHQWLVGDGSAVINTNIEDITNLTELYCYFYSDNPSNNERIFGREGNSRIVLRYRSVNNLEFFTSQSNNPEYITLRFNTEGYFYADFIANQASTSLSSPTNFIGNSDKIGNLGTIHLFGDKVASGPTSIVSAKIKSFRAAPFMDLVPCKLLKSIPSKYDANGIARQEGECGMYDTVNDKFYGNVASSGSFTVSDDN